MVDIKPEIREIIEPVISELYANDASKLKQMCNKEMMKFGGIFPKDYDDFYSRAGCDISLVLKSDKDGNIKYDPSCGKSFLEYITGVIRQSVWKEMTHRNRSKRQVVIEKEEIDESGNIKRVKEYISNFSVDATIDDDEEVTLGDIISCGKTVESEIFDKDEDTYSTKMMLYLSKLSEVQKEILRLIIAGYSSSEIKEELHISDKQYNDCQIAIHSYRNVSVLF